MKKKIIVFITGTRADYGKLKTLINRVEKSQSFESYIFVTGMHTLSKYGYTLREIEKNKHKNVFVYMNQTSITDMDTILANTIIGFGNFVKEVKPDMIVVHGDRVEALAGAIVGSLNNILVSHIEGGELSGTIDGVLRHTISKLSHVHFVCNESARKVLIQLGENKKNIFIIGSPDIDIMYSESLPSMPKVRSRYYIDFDRYSILIFHPVTTELKDLKEQINNILECILESNRNFIIIYPNNDAGSNIIIDRYNQIKSKRIKIFKSLRFEYFLTLLKNSDFIMGNSSSGIRESEIYGIPSINIGSRQLNRTDSKNIINTDYTKKGITNAIDKVSAMHIDPISNFGIGKSNDLFFKIICNEETWNINKQKYFNTSE